MHISRLLECANGWVRSVALPVVCAAGLLLAAVDGGAQARIDANTLGTESMNAQQKQEVDTYLNEQADALLSGQPQRVSQARAAMIDVFGRWGSAGSQAFIDYYNQQLATSLKRIYEADAPLLTRVNVPLVASRVLSPAVLPVFELGLADENEGVRFQIATSIGLLADRDAKQAPEFRLQESVWDQLLTVCSDRLKQETSPLVVQRLMVAMGKLPIAAAAEQVLEAIDGRVALHVQNPEQPMVAELEALKQVVLYINSQPEENRAELFKRAMSVSIKLAKVAAVQLARPMPEGLKDQRIDLIRYVDAFVFRDPVTSTFGVAANRLPGRVDQINANLRSGNVQEVQSALEGWGEFLAAAPIGLDPASMRIPQ